MKFLALLLFTTTLLASDCTVPCVDLSLFCHGDRHQRMAFAQELGQALQDYGCVAIENHAITPEIQQEALYGAIAYFQLPLETKMEAFTHHYFRGYIPFEIKTDRGEFIGDLKEFYQMTGPTQPAALWPKEQPTFKAALMPLYDASETCTRQLLTAVALYLGYEENETILADLIGRGNSVLRVLHYPPLDLMAAALGAVRAAEHEDVNIMTLFSKASAPGLQIKLKDGNWIDVVVPDGALIATPSAILAYLTNDYIKATTHRVINPPAGDVTARYAFPFFANPQLDAPICLLDKCSKGMIPPPIAYSELLYQRFQINATGE